MIFARSWTLALFALFLNLHTPQAAIEHQSQFPAQGAQTVARKDDQTFDVVSIRPSKPGGQLSFDVTADGFTAHSTPMFWVIMEAFYPRPLSYWRKDRLTDAPSWVGITEFDIEGKVSESELAAFKNLSDKEREERIKLMLRTALRERLNLQVSGESSPSSTWALTVGKHEPRISPSTSGAAPPPRGIPIGDGGVMRPLAVEGNRHAMQFYKTSMPAFAEVLAGLGTENDLPIVDNTGLRGRYDFVLPKREGASEPSEQTEPTPATQWDIEALGFHFRRMTQELPSIRVVHIEQPKAN